MNEQTLLDLELYVIPTVFLLSTLFMTAPYGKFVRDGWGWLLPGKWSFAFYEIVSPIVFLYQLSLMKSLNFERVMLGLPFLIHYVYRSIVFPFGVAHSMKPQPLTVIFSALSFNLVNGFNNAVGVAKLNDPNYLGLIVFAAGLAINIQSDIHLSQLRSQSKGKKQDGKSEYFIPYAGFYRWVSCANYFGEIVEWTGWAIYLNGPLQSIGFAFVLATMANLVPRALATHQWYQQKFSNYPKDRRAVIPFLL
jgi:3-oxo-5-alpha-steroid 4-dehydrogenase 1